MAGTLSTMEQTLEIYRKAPTYIDNIVLAAGVAKTVSAPTGATHCLFSSNGNYFVNWQGTTATVPAADITDGTGVEINPVGRALGGVDSADTPKTFSIISNAATIVAVAWLRI